MMKMHDDEFEKKLKANEEYFYDQHKKLFDLNVLLFRSLSDVLDKRVQNLRLNSDFQWVVNFLFCRSYRLHWTILILCQKGFGQEASILLRSLMEHVVNIAWIEKEKSDERAKLFLDYFHIARKTLYNKYEKHGIQLNLTDAQKELLESTEEIEKAYMEVKDNYSNECYWVPLSIRKRALDVKEEYTWDFYYWYYSFITHPSSASKLEFVRQGEEGHHFVIGPSDLMIRDVLHLSCKYLLLSFDMWNKVFELGLEGHVQEFTEKLKSISFVRPDQQSSMQEPKADSI